MATTALDKREARIKAYSHVENMLNKELDNSYRYLEYWDKEKISNSKRLVSKAYYKKRIILLESLHNKLMNLSDC